MTDTRELELIEREMTVIAEALAVIDQGLSDLQHRELVSSNEVADLLLDVRTLLVTDTPEDEVSPN